MVTTRQLARFLSAHSLGVELCNVHYGGELIVLFCARIVLLFLLIDCDICSSNQMLEKMAVPNLFILGVEFSSKLFCHFSIA